MRAEQRKLFTRAALLIACSVALSTALPIAVADETQPGARDATNLIEMGRRLAEAKSSMAAGDYDTAKVRLDMVCRLAESIPGDPKAQDAMAQAESLLKQMRKHRTDQEAKRKMFAELLDADADAEREKLRNAKADKLYDLARSDYTGKNYSRAKQRLNRVLDIAPDHPKAKRLAGAVDEKIKERREKERELDEHESWRRVFNDVTEASIATDKLLEYPDDWDRKTGKETVPEQLVEGHSVQWYEETSKQLYEKISFDGDGTPLRDVIGHIRDLTDLNIVIDPNCLAANEPVKLEMEDVSVRSALNSLCTFSNTHWAMADKMIIISNKRIRGDAFTYAYDISDLLVPPSDFSVKKGRINSLVKDDSRGDLSTGRVLGDEKKVDEAELKRDYGRQWVRFIRDTVEPASWHGSVEGGGSSQNTITFRNGRVVVTHSPEVHKQVLELLNDFRRARNIQVGILSRFVDMNKDFLDYLGIEYGGLGNTIGDATGYGGSALEGDDNYNPNFMNPFAPNWVDPTRGAGFRSTGSGVIDMPAGIGTEPYPDGTPATHPTNERFGDWEVRGGTAMSGAFEQPLGDPNKNFFYHGAGSPDEGLMLNYYHLGEVEVRAILEAVVKRRKGTILDAPRITCFNGQRANIVMTTEETYVRNLTEERQTEIAGLTHGVVFEIVPYVSSDQKYITIEMQPVVNKLLRWEDWEISDVDVTDTGGIRTTETSIRLPYVSVRALQTTITIPDGGTMMIGGMATADESFETISVPFVRKIPFLKWLFSARGRHNLQTSLVILVRGDILIQGESEPHRSDY